MFYIIVTLKTPYIFAWVPKHIRIKSITILQYVFISIYMSYYVETCFTVFYWNKLASLFQVQRNLRACRNSKNNFDFFSCFIAGDPHIKIIHTYISSFNEHDTFHFVDNVHLSKYYPTKTHQNWSDLFNGSNQIDKLISKFLFTLDL